MASSHGGRDTGPSPSTADRRVLEPGPRIPTRQTGQSPAASISSAHARPRPHPPLRHRTRALRHRSHRRRDDADLWRLAGSHAANGGRARRARTRPRRPSRHHPPEPARSRDPALGLPDRGGGDHAGELAREARGAGLRTGRRRRAGGVLRAGVGGCGGECFARPGDPPNRGGRRGRRQRRVRRTCRRHPRGCGTESGSGRRLGHALHLRHHGATEGGPREPTPPSGPAPSRTSRRTATATANAPWE